MEGEREKQRDSKRKGAKQTGLERVIPNKLQAGQLIQDPQKALLT